MNRASDKPVVANVLTGFLGSGKTSLLNRLLRKPDLNDTAVLINEFGEIGLDHLLIEKVEGEVVLLKSGCVCCTVRGDLKDAILKLNDRRRRGEVPPFTRLVIETTGIADPAPIVATLSADPMLRHHFRVGSIVTVVDALLGAGNLDAHEECARQVAAADRLVISKIDLAAPEQIAALRARLLALNPAASIVEADEDTDIASTLLTNDIHDSRTRTKQVRQWLARSDAAHSDTAAHGDIRPLLLTADAPLAWSSFGLWLSMLLNRHGSNILRLKGLVAIEGSDTPVVVQGVQHLIHKPLHLKSWPDNDRRTRLVVIAQGLDPALLQRSFTAFTQAGRGDRRQDRRRAS